MNRRPTSTSLSGHAMRALLDSVPHDRHHELSEYLGFEFFVLGDGRALIVLGSDQGLLYASFDEFQAMQRELRERQARGPVHVLQDLLPDGREFVRHLPELLTKLPLYLGLPESALDFSKESLQFVDDAITRLGSDRVLRPDHFSALTAYVGEVIRVAVNGKWDMRLDDSGAVWEPWIVDPAGGAYAAFMFVRSLYEDEMPSLHGFVLGQLQSSRLGPRGTTSS